MPSSSSSSSSPRIVASSAPGKVLLAGGYLVLERKYTGLVLGLDARIHTVIHGKPGGDQRTTRITVQSPQFTHARWDYDVELVRTGAGAIDGVRVRWNVPSSHDQTYSPTPNPFVETTIAYVFSYLSTRLNALPTVPSCEVRILADTAYYTLPSSPSQPGPESQSKNRFHYFGIPFADAKKTGLGSSAALVTSLTASLLQFYSQPSSSSSSSTIPRGFSRNRIHNLAQAAHCAAQGKVGSGFDVAAAVYGSCLYRRFAPSILDPKLDRADGQTACPETPGFAAWLSSVVDDEARWDTEVDQEAVKMPPSLRLVLCDVDCGSKTPGMVRDVLKWKKETGQKAEQMWDELQARNDALRKCLLELHDQSNPSLIKKEAEGAPSAPSSPHGIGIFEGQVRSCIEDIRDIIRRMSREAGVPIEPPAQTRLLDELTARVPGVVGGVVPGAGGFDAVALLVNVPTDTVHPRCKTETQILDNQGNEGRDENMGAKTEKDGNEKDKPAGAETAVLSSLREFLSTFDFFGEDERAEPRQARNEGEGRRSALETKVGKVSVLDVRQDDLGGLVTIDSLDGGAVGADVQKELSVYTRWI